MMHVIHVVHVTHEIHVLYEIDARNSRVNQFCGYIT